MASYKSFTVLLFATGTIILLVLCGIGEARHMKDSDNLNESLEYGAMRKDAVPGCSFHNPKECFKIVANHYHRGCEYITRCHRVSEV
ncbi:hypothetical protein EUTSA_v10017890mg [Eutrema salsugineum]|uniref:Uncharacterized protein n=1 Tax=Eutrema salsugineum TaxID=72664 RepID=V4NY49_EUTSA|nr:hypothetical protein EUTSA_v10017890mg [Eutrema salsugineum]